jgi:hypothetical protein
MLRGRFSVKKKWFSRVGSLFCFVTVTSTVALSCGKSTPHGKLQTVHIPQSPVGEQSTGNCWTYAYSGWLESLRIRNLGPSAALTFSETYLLYRAFEEQLLVPRGPRSKKLDILKASGDWFHFKRLVKKNGMMLDEHFRGLDGAPVPEKRQGEALAFLNAEIKKDAVSAWLNDVNLSAPERQMRVQSLLDEAFQIEFKTLERHILKTEDIEFGKVANGSRLTLATVLETWKLVDWKSSAEAPASMPLPFTEEVNSPERIALLKRVKKALNQGYPVVFNWFADYNARDQNGVFSLDLLKQNGPGKHGPHATILVDYTVKGVDPRTGVSFEVGIGNATPEQKKLAEEFGEIDSFLVKNSWGIGAEGSLFLHGSFGYHRIMKDYLFAQVLAKSETTGVVTGKATVLRSFLLPVEMEE